MVKKCEVFTTCDFEPWAVFYYGEEGFGLTKQEAIDEMKNCLGLDDEEELDCSEPHVFYMRQGNEEDDALFEDDYPFFVCDEKDKGAIKCFGCVFEGY